MYVYIYTYIHPFLAFIYKDEDKIYKSMKSGFVNNIK